MSNWVKYGEVENESELFVNLITGEKRQVNWKGEVYIYSPKKQQWLLLASPKQRKED